MLWSEAEICDHSITQYHTTAFVTVTNCGTNFITLWTKIYPLLICAESSLRNLLSSYLVTITSNNKQRETISAALKTNTTRKLREGGGGGRGGHLSPVP